MFRHRRPLVAGNWKMYGFKSSLAEIVAMRQAVEAGEAGIAEALICPPSTLIASAAALLEGGPMLIGAQDCHSEITGAYTGDVSAAMLKDAGASHVIVGHSERRVGHGETDSVVRAKAKAAIEAGMVAIVCVGETQAEREAGDAIKVICAQLQGSLPPGANSAQLVVAYEPVWAIGAGVTPSADKIAETHFAIRKHLGEICGVVSELVRILYGGSVKPANSRDLLGLPNVDGALVGGASLNAADFMRIASVYF
jgi:triosephosphate isomerase